MEQWEVARRPGTPLKPGTDDVACDPAKHAGPSQWLRQSQFDVGPKGERLAAVAIEEMRSVTD